LINPLQPIDRTRCETALDPAKSNGRNQSRVARQTVAQEWEQRLIPLQTQTQHQRLTPLGHEVDALRIRVCSLNNCSVHQVEPQRWQVSHDEHPKVTRGEPWQIWKVAKRLVAASRMRVVIRMAL
jgi:hypothetical protein